MQLHHSAEALHIHSSSQCNYTTVACRGSAHSLKLAMQLHQLRVEVLHIHSSLRPDLLPFLEFLGLDPWAMPLVQQQKMDGVQQPAHQSGTSRPADAHVRPVLGTPLLNPMFHISTTALHEMWDPCQHSPPALWDLQTHANKHHCEVPDHPCKPDLFKST
jgi:hypothetical protein